MNTNSGLSKKQRIWRKIFILIGIYAVLAAIFSLSVLWLLNNYYFAKSNDSTTTLSLKQPVNDVPQEKKQIKLGISSDSEYISFSNDNKYCMYLSYGNIFIKEISTNKIIHEITENIPISKAVLVDDRNIIIYFIISKVGSIRIKTYNIDTDKTTEQKTFNASAGSYIKDVEYSSLSGFIFINVENKSKDIIDKIYYITLMKRAKKLVTEKIVNSMVLLSNAFSLYYQNNNGVLFCNSKKIKGFEIQKINLIGRDSNDNIYVQSTLKRNTIYVLNNNKIIKTLYLKDTNYLKISHDRATIYAVYSDYVVNLTKDINKKISFDSKLSFVNVVNNRIYLKDKSNMIIWNNI